MKIVIPKETSPGEKRSAMTPQIVEKLKKLGADVEIEKGLGKEIQISDEDYLKKGATVNPDRKNLLNTADIVLRIKKPSKDELALCKKGCIHISFLDPFNEKELIEEMVKQNITAISLEMIPRTTIAQKMDTLSSQANLAGYAAVITATERLNKILPMMTTPAGTISPAKVFIIGVGVAGLQAIATARRLGAKVEAFDTRAVVEEQVKSLGAKFVKIDLGVTEQTKEGYAKALTPDQLEKQKEGMAKAIADADIVITTAQVFGRKAPLIVTKAMIEKMKKGSIIVDMAVESGGNVEGSKQNEIVDINGVEVMGLANLSSNVAQNASEMFASNLYNLIQQFWNTENKVFNLNLEDEILKGCVITHNGAIVNEKIKTKGA